MSQPNWELVANLGDVDAIEHGGLFVYRDTTDVYGFEATRLENDGETWEEHRVCLDRMKMVQGYLVPFAYDKTYPVSAYVAWFADSLGPVASCMGTTEEDLIAQLCSEDGLERAHAYRAIYDYHGWDNGDTYPNRMTRDEAERRFARETGDTCESEAS